MSRADEVLLMVSEAEKRRGQSGVRFSVKDLFDATKGFREKQKDVGKVEFVSSRAIRRNKQIIFRFETRAKTSGKAKYAETIIFHKVDFSDEQDSQHPLTVSTLRGDIFYSEKLDSKVHPVSVDCGCRDYYFTWWYYNFHRHRAQAGGRKRPYIRKTPPPPKGYPFRNPDKIPGLCKHLIANFNFLKKNKILV